MNIKVSKSDFFEIGGFISVLVGLIFVGTELAQNTEAVRAQTVQEVQRDVREHLLLGGELREIRAIPDSEKTEVERSAVRTHWLVSMRAFENQWYHFDKGLLDPQIFDGYARHLYVQLRTDTQWSWWEVRRDLGFFHPGFVDYVENVLLVELNSLDLGRLNQ